MLKPFLVLATLGLLPGPGPRPATHPKPAAVAPAPDSTSVRLRYGSPSAELNELMGRVLSIEEHRLELHDRRLAGRRLHLTWQEYRRGVPGPEKELTTDASLTRLDSAGRFRFTIYARQATPEQVENKFILPRASVTRSFKAAASQADKYSLRFDIHPTRRAADQAGAAPNSPAEEFSLPLGAKTILAVYTLPYEHEGMYLYCGLAQSRVPVTEWYRRFQVPHFVVYRARVE
ncbi:hypothetical protein HHL22_01610 [Hymenobacter sp. RP-2-7]|uniref:Uncharacterized protein n=1 Tax=Hymenobacter polaris TaxID=2682546 RepID=A0A7Y0AAS5_9BACT|nr:hypothetical protein [Hymenobacter polaris]NML63892.1 hypothetical protein [Hymenobacter polaris]